MFKKKNIPLDKEFLVKEMTKILLFTAGYTNAHKINLCADILIKNQINKKLIEFDENKKIKNILLFNKSKKMSIIYILKEFNGEDDKDICGYLSYKKALKASKKRGDYHLKNRYVEDWWFMTELYDKEDNEFCCYCIFNKNECKDIPCKPRQEYSPYIEHKSCLVIYFGELKLK